MPSARARHVGAVRVSRGCLIALLVIPLAVPVVASFEREGEASASTPAPWPMYGHDSAHRGASPAWGPSSEPPFLWEYPLGAAADDNAAPVVGPDGTVYVPTDAALFAINPDGTLRWRKWGTDAFDRAGTRSAPAIGGDGTVYVWKEAAPDEAHWPGGALFAVDPADGATLWSYVIGMASYGSPTVGPDGTIYVGSAEDASRLYALRPNGTLKWAWESAEDGCWIETSAAIGPGGQVYFWHNCQGLIALDGNGNLLWSQPMVGDAWNSPSVAPDGTVYIGNSDHYFYAFHPDGRQRWRVAVDDWMYLASASMSADGSTIYRGDNGGVFYAFASAGALRWKYDTGTDDSIVSAPAVAANGVVFFPAGGFIYALRASDGTLLWRRAIGESGQSPALGSDGTLYVVAATGSGTSALLAFGCGPDGDGDDHGDQCRDVTAPDAPVGTVRLAGSDRYETGVAISKASFPQAGSASAVVLARGDDPSGFADALSGTPLALVKEGPVLITRPDVLLDAVLAEIQRVLPQGRTVYVLGGESALRPQVVGRLHQAGYSTTRLWGNTRFDTALRVAEELDDADPILITTGDNFPDALAAGAAAAHVGGAVVLTPSGSRWPALDAYLASHPDATVYAVGGPAAQPYPDAIPLVGANRFDTAVKVARRFFASPASVGVARSDRFPDSLAGGALIAALEGPLLLTPTDQLEPAFTARYLCDNEAAIATALVFGGPAAIHESVRQAVADRIRGVGCA